MSNKFNLLNNHNNIPFNKCNSICQKNYSSSNCSKKQNFINSLLVVEKFLCCSQKACNLYKIFNFFNHF